MDTGAAEAAAQWADAAAQERTQRTEREEEGAQAPEHFTRTTANTAGLVGCIEPRRVTHSLVWMDVELQSKVDEAGS